MFAKSFYCFFCNFIMIQTGKFVLHNRDLGCAISDQVRAQARKFWKYFFSGAQFTKARMQNAIAQFLKRVERAAKWRTEQATHSKERRNSTLGETNET